MKPDDDICLCFHVSQRKVVNYCRRERPPVASLISSCLSAGTGCGWCIPYLRRLHAQVMQGVEEPSLKVSVEDYADKRQSFRKSGVRDEGEQTS